jgi:hypothetical protein
MGFQKKVSSRTEALIFGHRQVFSRNAHLNITVANQKKSFLVRAIVYINFLIICDLLNYSKFIAFTEISLVEEMCLFLANLRVRITQSL